MTDRMLSTVVKILSYQLLVITLVTAAFTLWGGWKLGMSPASGGAAAFIPNVYFALRVYKATGQEARKVINSFYAGEFGKLLLTAVLFVMIFQVPGIKILPLLAGYVAALSVFWFALLMR